MTDPVTEQLSACLDGELPEGELDLLLKRLQRDPSLRQSLGSYALIGEAMRNQRPVMASAGFAAKLSAAVAAEPGGKTVSRSVSRIPPTVVRWLRPVAGVAIAAGVAAVAVVSLQPAGVQPAQQIAASQNAPASVALVDESQAPSYTVPTNTSGAPAFIPAARLTNYVVAHSEYSSPLGRRTVLSGVLSDDDAEQNDDAATGQDDVVNVSGAEPQP